MKTGFPLIVATAFFILPASGQLIIEGGSGGVQRSNRDGRIEISRPAGFSHTVVTGQPVNSPLDSGIRTNSPARTGIVSNSAQVRSVPVPSAGIYTPAVRHVVDVNRIQAIQKLERELGVIKTTKSAWMEFDADRLFKGRQNGINSSARALLNKIITYHALTGGSGITVDYEYVAESDSCDCGTERSEAVVEYFAGKTGLSPGWFTVPVPEPLKRSEPQGYSNAPRRAYKSIVNIRIQR
ncbi:MAG: hypothetical protein P1V20_00995 [Verrucomicrobiales bacterium]|nr:hypothetical protein [Verrucomicrobiales bacterium]